MTQVLRRGRGNEMRPGDPMTPKQRAIWEYMHAYSVGNGAPPTFREIGERFGITINGVKCHMVALVKKGHVRHVGFGRSRGYVPVKEVAA